MFLLPSIFVKGFYLWLFVPAVIRAEQRTIFVTAPKELKEQTNQRQICSQNEVNNNEWTCYNWAGTVSWNPSTVFSPESEEDLIGFLERNANNTRYRSLKVIGSGHSWSSIYIPYPKDETERNVFDRNSRSIGANIILQNLSGIKRILVNNNSNNNIQKYVEVMAGTSFAQLHEELDKMGYTLAWLSGGIQGLTVGGAVSVGFHGSQLSLGSISTIVSNMHVLSTDGTMHVLDSNDRNGKALSAVRLGLGLCGVITRVTLPIVDNYYLLRRRWRVDDISSFVFDQLPSLKKKYDMFHYYIHPYTSTAWPMYWEKTTEEESKVENRPCRTALLQSEDSELKEYGVDGLPLIMRWDNCSDVSYKSYTHATDMDAQPIWNGEWFVSVSNKQEADLVMTLLEVFQQAAKDSEPDGVPSIDLWLHVRYLKGDDDTYLNPCYGWGLCQGFELALVAKTMDSPIQPEESWQRYILPLERVMKQLGGRPHWAKAHTVDNEYTRNMGLPIDEFFNECKQFDPNGLLGNHPELMDIKK